MAQYCKYSSAAKPDEDEGDLIEILQLYHRVIHCQTQSGLPSREVSGRPNFLRQLIHKSAVWRHIFRHLISELFLTGHVGSKDVRKTPFLIFYGVTMRQKWALGRQNSSEKGTWCQKMSELQILEFCRRTCEGPFRGGGGGGGGGGGLREKLSEIDFFGRAISIICFWSHEKYCS